jgi:hypothetical protein
VSGLKVYDEESIATLRSLSKSDPKGILENFDKVSGDLNLVKWLPSELKVMELAVPNPTSNFDKENSIAVFRALDFLTPALASDERVWVTLTFSNFQEYTKARWAASSNQAEELSKNLINHWFAPTARDRWRNNSISRLWWVGYFVESLENVDKSDAYDLVYFNSDLIASLLGRATLSSYKNIASAVIRVTHHHYLSMVERKYDRDSFRDFLKLIDLRLGKSALGSLDQTICDEIVFELFAQTH